MKKQVILAAFLAITSAISAQTVNPNAAPVIDFNKRENLWRYDLSIGIISGIVSGGTYMLADKSAKDGLQKRANALRYASYVTGGVSLTFFIMIGHDHLRP